MSCTDNAPVLRSKVNGWQPFPFLYMLVEIALSTWFHICYRELNEHPILVCHFAWVMISENCITPNSLASKAGPWVIKLCSRSNICFLLNSTAVCCTAARQNRFCQKWAKRTYTAYNFTRSWSTDEIFEQRLCKHLLRLQTLSICLRRLTIFSPHGRIKGNVVIPRPNWKAMVAFLCNRISYQIHRP